MKHIKINVWALMLVGGAFASGIVWLLSSLLTEDSEALTIAVVAGIFTITGAYLSILSAIAAGLLSPPPGKSELLEAVEKYFERNKE